MTYMTDQRDRPLVATVARGRANHWSVFWVDLLTGWTGIGWAIALYMSLTSHHVWVGPRRP